MDGDGGDDGSLLSFDDPGDGLDDVGGAHDDVALGDGGGGHTCSSCLLDGCLMMALEP